MAAVISWSGLGSLVGAILLAVVVWLFAPAIGVNATWLLVLLTVLPLLIWLVVMIWLVRRAHKRDAALVAGATQPDEKAAKAEAAAAAAAEEEKAVSGRLAEALAAMKAAGGGKGGYLYERPWYVMIGPPGSGKTTAIRNSGLDFPLAEGRVSGVGGTRNCDWWISEQAVLIDTAGRYTTQDSDAASDKAGWERFLELLRRERPRQPLNGVVVAFGVDMLSRLDPATRELHAQAVRRRVRELESKLGQRLPVYFVVSKADLVVGFTEFFDDLEREARNQVWGLTFAPEQTPEGPVEQFTAEFGGLVQRLQDRLLERLQAERGAEQRARIAGFPAQFASLEAPLAAFIKAAFGGSKLDPAPFLRGVYLTSGTQEGTPIDRLTGALSRAFGLDPSRPAAVMAQKGRSYFLGRLLREVVFNEARLAARDRNVERRRRIIQIAAWSSATVVVLLGIGWGWRATSIESDRRQQASAALQAAEASAKALGLPLDTASARDDVARLLPYLDSAAALPAAADGGSAHLGLSQQPKLAAAGELAYKHVLERVFLPRVLARLEGQLRENMQKPAYLYLAARVYLMLGRQGPLDPGLIQEWMAADWAMAYPGAAGQPVRDKLMGHLDAFLDQDFATYAVDGKLVDEARRVFSRMPMSDRVYARLRGSAPDVPPWRPAEALGLAGQRLFVGTSGAPVTDAAVPGLFTVEGLYRSFLPRLPKAMDEAKSESWVLGPEAAATASDPQLLEAAVLRLYAQDYIAEWQKMLDGISLAPLGGPAKAAEALNLLGAPNSPLRDLLQGVARQLSPGTPPAEPAAGAGAGAAASAAAAATKAATKAVAKAAATALKPLPGAGSRVAEAMGLKPSASAASVVAQIIEERFKPLREAAGKPLDGTLAVINALYVQVAKMASTAPGAGGGPPAAGLDPSQQLQAEAQRAPEPLSRWLRSLASTSSGVVAGGTKAALAAAGKQQLAPFCQGVEARFPFKREPGAPDMPMVDFARLFGRGGAFEQFFAQNLASIVDRSQSSWKAVVPEGAPAPISPGDLAQFQRADVIREAFFPPALPNQTGAGFTFELVPVSLDGGAKGAVLEAGGTKSPIAAGAQGGRPVTLQWPSQGNVSLSFDGEPTTGAMVNDGPWAALRFVARGKLTPTADATRLRLNFQQGLRTAEFELRTNSRVHPFALRELAEFRCPQLAP